MNRSWAIGLYTGLAVAGLVGTWWFNVRSITAGEDYLAGWFANAAASSAAVDVIVVALAACLFFVLEGRRLHLRLTWLLVPMTFVVAVAFTFPLFLALRERHIQRAQTDLDGPGMPMVGSRVAS